MAQCAGTMTSAANIPSPHRIWLGREHEVAELEAGLDPAAAAHELDAAGEPLVRRRAPEDVGDRFPQRHLLRGAAGDREQHRQRAHAVTEVGARPSPEGARRMTNVGSRMMRRQADAFSQKSHVRAALAVSIAIDANGPR